MQDEHPFFEVKNRLKSTELQNKCVWLLYVKITDYTARPI